MEAPALFFLWREIAIEYLTAVLVVDDIMYRGERMESHSDTVIFARCLSPIERCWLTAYFGTYKANTSSGAQKLLNEFDSQFGLFLAELCRGDYALTRDSLMEIHAKEGARLTGNTFYQPSRHRG